MSFTPRLRELLSALRCLPGVGPKSAQRIAFHLLDKDRNPPLSTSMEIDMQSIVRVLKRHNYQHYLSMPLVRDKDDWATAGAVRHLRTLTASTSFN